MGIFKNSGLKSSRDDEDDSASTSFATPSARGLERAKRIARSAHGLLSGTVEMARKVVYTKTPKSLESKKRGDELDDEGDNKLASESDDGDEESVSISDPVSRSANRVTTIAQHASEQLSICRPRSSKRGPFDYEGLRIVQELSNEHTGAVWCVKFSVCGRLFATAGQDNIVRVWVLKNYLGYFTHLRERYSQGAPNLGRSSSSTMLDIENLRLQEERSQDNISADIDVTRTSTPSDPTNATTTGDLPFGAGEEKKTSSTRNSSSCVLVSPKPFCVFRGHTADVLDLSWSPRNYFVLSSGMDRTVKLWHLTRNECLCCFQHMDFVTCISFMRDDRYFISGSMDGKIRLWNVSEKKVALWNEVEEVSSRFITAIAFVRNGKFVAVGTYNGRCFFYSTDKLKYHTVLDVRSSRGKNARGHKITSLSVHGDRLLVTSNDSRIRIYDLRDMTCVCKFKGATIEHSQIRASFSPDGRHIISGSEDAYVYIWRTGELPSSISATRNNLWERIRGHNAAVTAAVFVPKPHLFLSGDAGMQRTSALALSQTRRGMVITRGFRFAWSGISSIRNNNAYPVVNLTGSLGGSIINDNNNPSSFSSALNPSTSSTAAPSHSPSSKERRPRSMGDVIVSADLNGLLRIFAVREPVAESSSLPESGVVSQ